MIEVFDYRVDLDENVIVRPELRGRFLRLEPMPPGPIHSHDLAGEVFLVLEGRCEFIVEDERVTCESGQLIYVDKMVRHTLHAVGDGPCTLYLSVTPHVEPTHTFYDEQGDELPIRYDAWLGRRFPDGSSVPGVPGRDPAFAEGTLTSSYVDSIRQLVILSQAAAGAANQQRGELDEAVAVGDPIRAKAIVDDMWRALRDVLAQVGDVERSWNALSPQVGA